MKTPPMFLATGSFDGEIVIWNSVTEFACKHLISRKRVLKSKEVFLSQPFKISGCSVLILFNS
jgi:hypothetical protein